MCARDEWDNTEQGTTKTATLRARSRVQVTVGFHVVLRVVSLDIGFHVVIGVGRRNVQQDGFIRQLHFTTHTQYQGAKFFSSGCCSPTLSCHRPLNLISQILAYFSSRKRVL